MPAGDLVCDVCGNVGYIHRVEPKPESSAIRLHLKCPTGQCNTFWTIGRTPTVADDGTEVVEVGYDLEAES